MGGYAFNNGDGPWRIIRADGFARDAEGAARVVNEPSV